MTYIRCPVCQLLVEGDGHSRLLPRHFPAEVIDGIAYQSNATNLPPVPPHEGPIMRPCKGTAAVGDLSTQA